MSCYAEKAWAEKQITRIEKEIEQKEAELANLKKQLQQYEHYYDDAVRSCIDEARNE